MAFAVICKSCQARFLLNDDLLRRRVAGRAVTVRCRQCHASIEVEGSDVGAKASEGEKPEPKATTQLMFKSPRPAPAPPRPGKSTLMGIGAPRPAGATELVALSPGLLGVETETTPAATSRHGFPEPPPPPGAVEELDADDWEVEGVPTPPRQVAAPVSLDDFVEELPPSVPPLVDDELPSSTGTPSLKALTHHDEHAPKPLHDDFLSNMTAAMNGGILSDGAPTIDVSQLATPAAAPAPGIDLSDFEFPTRGAPTLPLFEEPPTRSPIPPPAAPPRRTPEGSLKPVTADPPALELPQQPDSARERKNVVAPSADRVAPQATARRSGLAAPLLVALAAAAAFLIWKRSATQPPADALARAERGPEAAAPAVVSPPPPTPQPAASEAPVANAEPSADDVTFETAPTKAPTTTHAASPESAGATAAITRQPRPEPAPAVTPEPTAEPAPAPPAEPAGPFDRAAAAAALTDSAGQASACRKEGDPSGVASVVVTFAPSGRVTSATIGGPPFAGTPTGSCIAAALRRARVPAFDGDRVTVSKTVVIQ